MEAPSQVRRGASMAVRVADWLWEQKANQALPNLAVISIKTALHRRPRARRQHWAQPWQAAQCTLGGTWQDTKIKMAQ